jgi:hypothetical protein
MRGAGGRLNSWNAGRFVVVPANAGTAAPIVFSPRYRPIAAFSSGGGAFVTHCVAWS